MGSHAITYAVVALAIAAVCLIAGFFWGRSDTQAKVEQAVEKEHVALDARQFTMRTQLEDAIAEIARLQPLAEELSRVQKRLEREQAKYAQMRAEFNAAVGVASEHSEQEDSDSEPRLERHQESADEAIQKLMQSLEAFNDPAVMAAPPSPEPATIKPLAPLLSAVPAVPKAVAKAEVPKPAAAIPPTAEPPKAVRPSQAIPPTPAPTPSPLRPQPAPAGSTEPLKPALNIQATAVPAPVSIPKKPSTPEAAKPNQQVDEWQEFARQLEALTGKKK